ncbi:Abi family protein [Mycoplasmatota bacterium WC30]
MCTADIAGSRLLVTKLSLDISKDDFVSKMDFEDDKEKERCLLYLDLKGVSYHTILVNYIGLREDGKIQYKKVQNLYIYDKRLRNILYKYLSALEEGIRGYISNKYCSKLDNIKILSKSIHKSITEGNSLSKELEDLDFNHLMNLTKKLTAKEKRELFGQNDKLEENLLAVKELRNAVSHHRMLFVYEDFYECYLENGTIGNSLMDNIVNLRQLLNPYYRDFFKGAINHSTVDKKDLTFITTLPDKAILYF